MGVVTAPAGPVVVARPDLQDEGISVRRTRVFVLPSTVLSAAALWMD